MFFQLSNDYIKYLNDPDCYGLNYDQWKDRKMRQEMEKSKQINNKKTNSGISLKYNY